MMIASRLRKEDVGWETVFWAGLVVVQLCALVNLIVAPHALWVPATVIGLCLALLALMFRKVLLALLVTAIIASEALFFQAGPVVVRVIDIALLYTGLLLAIKWLIGVETGLEAPPKFYVPFAILLLAALISLKATLSFSRSLLEIIQLVELLIAAVLIYNLLRDRSDVFVVLATMLAYGLMDALWMFFQYERGTLIGRRIGFLGTLGNELSYGVTLSVAFFYFLRRGVLRAAILLGGALQLGAIFLTRGRGTLIVAVIMAVTSGLLLGMKRRRFFSFVIVAMIIVVSLLGFFRAFSFEEQTRYVSIFTGGQMRDLRLVIWAVALRVWRHSPWFGVGMGNTAEALNEFAPKTFGIALTAMTGVKSAHNEYLNFAMQAGVFGLLASIAFYAILLWRAAALYFKCRGLSDELELFSVVLLSFVIGLSVWTLANDVLLAGNGMVVMLFIALISRTYALADEEIRSRTSC